VDTLVLALRLLLAAVFAVAGVAKLRDAEGSRSALEDFGVPARFTRLGGVLLPLAEIAVAVALLFPPSARWAAVAATVLLGAFMLAIGNAMRHGREPDCHCFGQLHSEPAGRGTLVRNAVLLAAAGVVAVSGPGPAVDTWVGDRSTAELLVLAVLLVAAAFAIRLLRRPVRRWQQRRAEEAHRKRHEAELAPFGLPIGTAAPDFSLPVARGGELSLDALCARGRPVVLVYIQPGCGPCAHLLPTLAEWRARLEETVTIAVLSEGSAERNAALAERHGLDELLVQEHAEVYSAYQLRGGTPAAVVVDPDRTIGSVSVGGTPAIEELIRLTLRRSGPMAELLAS
jgi:peroxiredoxin/uncharacterized membrane protein YphA (DoxX/SURF4 family)